ARPEQLAEELAVALPLLTVQRGPPHHRSPPGSCSASSSAASASSLARRPSNARDVRDASRRTFSGVASARDRCACTSRQGAVSDQDASAAAIAEGTLTLFTFARSTGYQIPRTLTRSPAFTVSRE